MAAPCTQLEFDDSLETEKLFNFRLLIGWLKFGHSTRLLSQSFSVDTLRGRDRIVYIYGSALTCLCSWGWMLARYKT
jgi:hypothetical protein